jgi:glycosyltransferase involved in cell wall biosynthesis
MNRPLKVTWVGLRGFPGVQGGVEKHAEQLCPLLAELGCEVRVLTRRRYQANTPDPAWRGVRFLGLWAPRHKHLEAVVHTFLAILVAAVVERPDVLHIQAIGPGLWAGWARLLGLKVVVTHHGPDYDRQKWGRLARGVLRLGERSSVRWAHGLIVISRVIQNAVAERDGRCGTLIRNGLTLPQALPPSDALRHFGLTAGRYILLVSRLVPEKRHLDLIEAFRRAGLPGWKLVIVGAADHADAYAQTVMDALAGADRTVATGLQSGAALQDLYANAGFFVLPSSHEGLPIALLEALSFGLPVLASDIPANLEIGLPAGSHFPLGDIDALADRLTTLATTEETAADRQRRQAWAAETFSWERSARETLAVYTRIASAEDAKRASRTAIGQASIR